MANWTNRAATLSPTEVDQVKAALHDRRHGLDRAQQLSRDPRHHDKQALAMLTNRVANAYGTHCAARRLNDAL